MQFSVCTDTPVQVQNRQKAYRLPSDILTPKNTQFPLHLTINKNPMKPHYKTIICDTETPVSLYSKLAQHHAYAFLLESAEPHQNIGKYSIIGFEPQELLIFPVNGKKNPLDAMKKAYEKFSFTPNPDLPRIQAPFVGYFSYGTARHFENIELPTKNAEIPEGIFFLPKNLLIFDHFKRTLTAISYDKKQLEKLLKDIKNIKYAPNPKEIFEPQGASEANDNDKGLNRPKGETVTQNVTSRNFEKLVSKTKENIYAGEIFQIVLCQTFQQKTEESPFDLFRILRRISPSRYMYYLQYPDFSVIGSSPETLIKTQDDEIVLRPIAGTRRRGRDDNEDKKMEEELKNDTKEQAEHMMLVDLGRNDVGRVAQAGTVEVTQLMEVEKFSHVMHLVSEVRGKRKKNSSLFDIFKAAFPAGTLTGAPKIRAMEIIADLEKAPRGIYGGAVGYFDLSGDMDFAIAIRTMVYRSGVVTLRAGAGIVYDSIPELEDKECHNKAAAPLTALL